jgi:uncharacterized protein YhaN
MPRFIAVKILQLLLRCFAHFEDRTLDLSAGQHGLHLVYGLNEAGKTCALRALWQFFHGFETRSADGFQFANSKLRIGARIQSRDAVQTFFRRKSKPPTLFDESDSSSVDDAELGRLLGNLDRDEFRRQFALDHASLVAGGQAMLDSDAAESIFAARSGLHQLNCVRKTLQDEIDRLFLPRGTVGPEISRLLTEHDSLAKQLRQASLSSDAWHNRHGALTAARDKVAKLASRRTELEKRQLELERILLAIPLAAKHKALVEQAASLRDVCILPDDFDVHWSRLQSQLEAAEGEIATLEISLANIEAKRSKLHASPALLALVPEIESIQNATGAHLKAKSDRAGIDMHRKQHEHAAQHILRSLCGSGDLSRAEEFVLRAGLKERVEHLGRRQQKLEAVLESARSELASLESEIASNRIALDQIPEPPDDRELIRTIDWVRKHGDLQSQLADLERARDLERSQALARLARAGKWTGTLDALERAPLPSSATIDRFDGEFRAARERLERAEEKLGKCNEDIRALETEIATHCASGTPPTEEALASSRGERDRVWQRIRRAWLESESTKDGIDRNRAGWLELASEFERAIHRADDLADRLRREADRVAQLAEFQRRLVECRAARDRANDDLSRAQGDLARIEAAWAREWQAGNVVPATPSEMRTWRTTIDAILASFAGVREKQIRVDDFQRTIADCRDRLRNARAAIGEPTLDHIDDLAALLAACDESVRAIGERRSQRQSLLAAIRKGEAKLPERASAVRTAEENLRAWQTEWNEAMAELGLDGRASVGEANEVISNREELFLHMKDYRENKSRVDGIDRDALQFSERVECLARACGYDRGDELPEISASEICRRVLQAREDHALLQTLNEQEAIQRQRLDDARRRAEEARLGLRQACLQAGVADAASLRDATDRSRHRSEIERALRETEANLLTHSGGRTLAEFVAILDECDFDSARIEQEQARDELRQLGEQLDELNRSIGEDSKELEMMAASSDATRHAARLERLRSQITQTSRRYAVFKIAQAVLDRAIARNSAASHSQFLETASRLFATLTERSFVRLDVEKEGQKAILVGVRNGDNRNTVKPSGMSEGTCDQLYLALRLASIHEFLDDPSREPLPFITDDILKNFDDPRAAATLRVLGELSRRTQVIFFTHHRHLVDLAHRVLPPDVLFTHELTRG